MAKGKGSKPNKKVNLAKVSWVSKEAGEKYGVTPKEPVTEWVLGKCDITGKEGEVTEARRYGIVGVSAKNE